MCATKAEEYKPVLTKETINPLVLEAKYAVRGRIPSRADEIQSEIDSGEKSKWPFEKVIYCNIGNPQQLEQEPLTFYRQVCALVVYPKLLKDPHVGEIFPVDVRERAQYIIDHTPGGIGAYSKSQGLEFVRKDVADFIGKRDGFPCSARSIFLTQGASPGIQTIMNVFIRKPTDGCLVPTPQYPLYSGSLALYGGRRVPYFLDEKTGWSLSVAEMKRSLDSAKEFGIETRAIVVINPGNPTGACLTEQNILDILRFARREHLIVMADEVYQKNIYRKEEKPFISFRQVLLKNEAELKGLELVSFNSISKGFMGECGIRGGYFQMENVDEEVQQELVKLASLSLCPNLMGQVIVDLMVKPPAESEPSYELYQKESGDILRSLANRARRLSEMLDNLPCCSCQTIESSLYAFPQIFLPPKFIEEAQQKGIDPDEYYCLSLIEKQGLCIVPGSGFEQEKGTHHARITILPPENQFDAIISKFALHHEQMLKEYATPEWIDTIEKEKKRVKEEFTKK